LLDFEGCLGGDVYESIFEAHLGRCSYYRRRRPCDNNFTEC
jgi:hypothetical protein